MKYKFSMIICALIVAVLFFSYFVTDKVEISPEDRENRRMYTFSMIFNPVTDKESEIYNEDKNIADRLEDALKDQLFLRNFILYDIMNPLETRLANMYNDVVKLVADIKPKPDVNPTEDKTDVGENVGETNADETDEPLPPFDDIPDEYYDLKAEEVLEIPDVLDFKKYPVTGYAKLKPFTEQNYTYSVLGNYAAINGTDWLMERPSKGSKNADVIKIHIDQFKRILKEFPDIKMYNYFVGQIYYCPWFNEFIGTEIVDRNELAAQYLPDYIKSDRFVFSDFEDYKETNFKTDHHWSYKGSERGYEDVYAMMAEDLDISPMKYPIKTWNFTELYGVKYVGSRGRTIRGYSSYDEFIVYEYDLGERETYAVLPDDLDVEIPVELSLMNNYKVGRISQSRGYDHYISFYSTGVDSEGETYQDQSNLYVIKNKNNGAKHNLLIVGDSTQRAYRDVLASHYNTTVYMDYRVMAKVPIDTLIEKYDIDTILVGGIDAFWYGGDVYTFNMGNIE